MTQDMKNPRLCLKTRRIRPAENKVKKMEQIRFVWHEIETKQKETQKNLQQDIANEHEDQ